MRKKVPHHDAQDFEQEELEPSKSQRKRDMEALQSLGAQLVELDAAHLKQFIMPENLLEALLEAQTIKAHGAKRRQLQYIGKLMRNVDADALYQQFEAYQDGSQTRKRYDKLIETWREKLLDSKEALEDFTQQYPESDAQKLEQLIVEAKSETQQAKQLPKAYRALYQYLKTLIPFSLLNQ